MKIPFLLTLILSAFLSYSQTAYMRVCKNNGTIEVFALQEIGWVNFNLTPGPGVGISENLKIVSRTFTKLISYPNPFNGSTTLEYELPESGNVEIIFVDMFGKVFKKEQYHNLDPGKHFYIWDCGSRSQGTLSSGIYNCIVRFLPNSDSITPQVLCNKMILIN